MFIERANGPTSSRQEELSFTETQREALWSLAEQVAGPRTTIRRLSFNIIGIEDLARTGEAQTLLDALQREDWQAASLHQVIAGTNDLLLGILLQVQTKGGNSSGYWVAMRSPFDLFESSQIVAYGRVQNP
jgi:hypothetical protein